MLAQLSAPNTARQLSQATMRFDGLLLDDPLVRSSSMPGQLNLVSPPCSLLNALTNDPLILNQSEAHINAPAIAFPSLPPEPLSSS